MKAVKEFLAHLAIAMLLGLVVIAILDDFNPFMAFLTSKVTKIYIVILCVVGVTVAAMYIAQSRRD